MADKRYIVSWYILLHCISLVENTTTAEALNPFWFVVPKKIKSFLLVASFKKCHSAHFTASEMKYFPFSKKCVKFD